MKTPQTNSYREKLSEINRRAGEYQLYLRRCGVSEEKIKACTWILRALNWQAGEQMEYLEQQIVKGERSGKSFTALIGLAHSILSNLEAAAEKAMIGEKIGKGYVIKSETNHIKCKKLFGKRAEGEIETYDWDYFKFLRSFICVHPLETNHKDTIDGFIPGEYAYCSYVDGLENDLGTLLKSDSPETKNADYLARVLGPEVNEFDIYIDSSEIWTFVRERFNQLVTKIHKNIIDRINTSIDAFKEEKIIVLGDEPDLKSLEELIKEDWRRNGLHHENLMRCKVALLHSFSEKKLPAPDQPFLTYIWNYVKELRDEIQSMNCSKNSDFYEKISDVMSKIGFDSNQHSNFCHLDSFHYGEDSENYVKGGTENYTETKYELSYRNSDIEIPLDYHTESYTEKRERMFTEYLSRPEANSKDQGKRLSFVSSMYFTHGHRDDVARFYFLIVLPDFVNKYNLRDSLFYSENYPLFIQLFACAIDHTKSHQKMYNGVTKLSD